MSMVATTGGGSISGVPFMVYNTTTNTTYSSLYSVAGKGGYLTGIWTGGSSGGCRVTIDGTVMNGAILSPGMTLPCLIRFKNSLNVEYLANSANNMSVAVSGMTDN